MNKIFEYIKDAVVAVASGVVFYYASPYFIKMYIGAESFLNKAFAFVVLALLCFGLYFILRRIFGKYQKDITKLKK